MRILLDTHVVLWWLNDDAALGAKSRCLIGDPSNTIFLSSVSTWEIWLKKSLGKLELPDEFDKWLSKEEFEPLPLTDAHTRVVADLPWHHRDPFDRMLVAQAMVSGLTLLTSDERLTAYGSFVKPA
jgi:PIN domain nuclease of toxin-antitoxin system